MCSEASVLHKHVNLMCLLVVKLHNTFSHWMLIWILETYSENKCKDCVRQKKSLKTVWTQGSTECIQYCKNINESSGYLLDVSTLEYYHAFIHTVGKQSLWYLPFLYTLLVNLTVRSAFGVL